MKVMLRNDQNGKLIAYVAKKDLEEEVVGQSESEAGKVLTLANGWELEFPTLKEPYDLPGTFEAKRL